MYASYQRSYFFVSQSKVLRTRARRYLFELRQVTTCLEESHSLSCLPSLSKSLAAGISLSSFTDKGPGKVAYPILKHLPRSGINFLLHILNISWSLNSLFSPFRLGLTNQSLFLVDSFFFFSILIHFYRLLKGFRLYLASRYFPQIYFGWPFSLLCLLDSSYLF